MFLKETVTELELRCTDLQGENREIQKQLRDCHVLLVAENLDPGDDLIYCSVGLTHVEEQCVLLSCNLNSLKFSFRGKVGSDSTTEGRTKKRSYGICIFCFIYINAIFLLKNIYFCICTHIHTEV